MDSSVEHQDIQSNPELNRSVDSSSSNSYVSDNEITGNWDTVQDGEVDPIGYQQKQYYFADQDNKQLKLAESDKSDQDVFTMLFPSKNSNQDTNYAVSSNTGCSSGKYILRSARHPDPLHFIHRVKLLSSDVDPEMDELVTIIRSTETEDTIQEQGRSALQSIITSELIKQFDKSENDNVEPETGAISTSSHPEGSCHTSEEHLQKMEGSISSIHNSDATDSINITAPIASLSEVDLSDSDDNDLDTCLGGQHTSDDLQIKDEHIEGRIFSEQINDVAFSIPESLLADDPSKFEETRRQSELSSPKQCPSLNESVGLKGELTNDEDDMYVLSTDDEEEMDTVSALKAPSPSIQNKEQLNNLDDLDLPSGEKSPGLNLDASKQKVQLRQRGSLAKRRKPTRTSIRTTSQSHDLFTYNTDTTEKLITNGYEVSMETTSSSQSEASTPDTEQHYSVTNVDMSTTSQQELIKPGKNIHGIKTAIVQSEIVTSGRQRLRSIPTSAVTEKRSSSVSQGESLITPPWMVEAKLRRSSRPSKGEDEKQKQSPEPQTPPWLKEALMKKRRPVSRTSQNSMDEMTVTTADSGHSTSVPWIQEAALRRTRQLEPLTVSQKDFTNNVNNMIADSSHDDVFVDDMDEENGKNEQVISSSGRESLTKFSMHFQEQENLPPLSSTVNRSPSETDAYLHKYEKLPPVKHILPPGPALIKKTPSHPMNISSAQEKDEPVWKAEIVMRRKSKSYLVAQKPEQPLKLGEMPQWKKDLLEKNKLRRVSSEGGDTGDGIPAEKKLEISAQTPDVPPWKVELAQRRRSRLSSIGVAPEALETLIEQKKSQAKHPEEEPEWAQLVARRRQRLASSGLLAAEECAKTN